jgi:hypothetical protein
MPPESEEFMSHPRKAQGVVRGDDQPTVTNISGISAAAIKGAMRAEQEATGEDEKDPGKPAAPSALPSAQIRPARVDVSRQVDEDQDDERRAGGDRGKRRDDEQARKHSTD